MSNAAAAQESAEKIFKSVRMISVSNLAQRLGIDRALVLEQIAGWETRGIIRVVNGTGCGSCSGCGSGCSPDETAPAGNEKLLISLVKEIGRG